MVLPHSGVMRYRKISDQANIRQTASCPVRILSCSVYCEEKSQTPVLQMELQNDSNRVLAALVLLINCYDRDGGMVSFQEQVFYKHENFHGGQYALPQQRVTFSDAKIERVSVSVQKVLAFRVGDFGEVEDITSQSAR